MAAIIAAEAASLVLVTENCVAHVYIASCGVEIRQAQFSTFKIGYVIAFKKYGIWVNCSNSLSSTFQHVQHCTFNIYSYSSMWLLQCRFDDSIS